MHHQGEPAPAPLPGNELRSIMAAELDMHDTTCAKCAAVNESGSKFCSQCAAPLPVLSEHEQKKTNRIAGIGMILALVALPIAFIATCGSASVEGELRSRGKPHGDFTLKPPNCHSGEHESFFGVWVASQDEEIDGREGFRGGLKIVKNHLGDWELFVESPLECQGLKCKTRPLDRAHCSTFDVHVRNTNTSYNDIRVREGHARLECRFPEGGSLSADLKFEGCS